MEGINYITDDRGKRTAVVIDLNKYSTYLEDFFDGLEAESRLNEPKIPFEVVKKNLIAKGKLKA
jgi:hypothetical protein